MSLCSRRLYGSGGGPRRTSSSVGSVSRFGGMVGDVGAEDSVTFSVAAVFVVGAVSTVGSAFVVGGIEPVVRPVSAASVGIAFVASVVAGTVCPGIVFAAVVFSAVVAEGEAIVDMIDLHKLKNKLI